MGMRRPPLHLLCLRLLLLLYRRQKRRHHVAINSIATAQTVLLLLLTCTYLRVIREQLIAAKNLFVNHTGGHLSQPADHIFIYGSFLYPPRSKAFVHSGEASNNSAMRVNTTILATLFTADDSRDFSSAYLYCVHWGSIGGLLSNSGRKLPLIYTDTPVRQAVPIRLIELPQCRLRTYVALCEFFEGELPYSNESSSWYRESNKHSTASAINAFGIIFRNERWGTGNADELSYVAKPHLLRRPHAIPLTPIVADTTPRQLVLCVSRVFAFENWRLLVTALEVYRRLGVDLVVTHVLSAVFPLFALMRHYESAGRGGGLLRVKPAVVFPTLRLGSDGGIYDPNAETEHTNQLTAAHECLYEFKASADFIALVDWDDLLVTDGYASGSGGWKAVGHSHPLGEAFHMALKDHPQAAYFNVNKLQAAMPALKKDAHFDVVATMKGIRSSLAFFEHKLVVVPSRLHGVHIHLSGNIAASEYREVHLPTKYAFMLHLASEGHSAEHIYDLEHLRLNWTLHFEDPTTFASSHHLGEHASLLVNTLETLTPLYAEKIGRCATLLRRYFFSTLGENVPCPGYHQCGIVSVPGVKCVNAKNTFRPYQTGAAGVTNQQGRRNVIVHVRQSAGFVESDQGCSV